MIYKATNSKALIRNGIGGPHVSFGTLFALPGLHRVKEIDLSAQKIEMSFLEKGGLICRDGIKADLRIRFLLAPNPLAKDILLIDQALGSEITGMPEKLKTVFDARFTESIKSCIRKLEFVELFENPDQFREAILQLIGTDLHGFFIQDCSVIQLEQTALEFHDPNNISEAQGIRKITEKIYNEKKETNALNRKMEKEEARRKAQKG